MPDASGMRRVGTRAEGEPQRRQASASYGAKGTGGKQGLPLGQKRAMGTSLLLFPAGGEPTRLGSKAQLAWS